MKIKSFISSLMLIFLLTGCKSKPKNEIDNTTNPITVITQKTERVPSHKSLSVSGNIEGNKTVRLGFMVAGKINYISAQEGQSVNAGQLLASLDPESYKIAKDIADANLNQTQDEYNRLRQMHERNSISDGDYSKITNGLKVADAQQRLQAKNLKETKLYVPFSGVLLKRGVEIGEIINTGMPLFVVSDIYTVKVNASVPESELQNVHIGIKADVKVASLNSTYEGIITEISSVAEPTTRTFSVKIEMKNPKLLLKPGMTAEIQIPTHQTEQIITIPAQSVLQDTDNSSYVFIADTAKKIAIKRNISLGGIIGDNIKVISGLNENDLVIISGQQKLTNGTPITIK